MLHPFYPSQLPFVPIGEVRGRCPCLFPYRYAIPPAQPVAALSADETMACFPCQLAMALLLFAWFSARSSAYPCVPISDVFLLIWEEATLSALAPLSIWFKRLA